MAPHCSRQAILEQNVKHADKSTNASSSVIEDSGFGLKIGLDEFLYI